MVRVKVCCIASVEEIQLATREGADALGLVAEMPSGPGVLDDERIAVLAARVPPGVGRFLLTQQTTVDAVVEHVQRTGVDTVQICDHVPEGVLADIRRNCPARVVAVVHVLAVGVEIYARRAGSEADALLLDSGQPGADFKELGGTGRTHDWSISERIVEAAPVPVWLAGGLNPENVAEGIRKVKPFGVDLCTGIRTEGTLDPKKLRRFMQAVRSTRC